MEKETEKERSLTAGTTAGEMSVPSGSLRTAGTDGKADNRTGGVTTEESTGQTTGQGAETVRSGKAGKQENELCPGICPYFQRDRGRGIVYCEGAKFRFPDKQSRREIVYRFCAHPDRYKLCVLKQALDHYYERKYNQIESENRRNPDGN